VTILAPPFTAAHQVAALPVATMVGRPRWARPVRPEREPMVLAPKPRKLPLSGMTAAAGESPIVPMVFLPHGDGQVVRL
jgi:hypothetical protein